MWPTWEAGMKLMQVDTGRINLHQLLKTRAQSGYWHSIKHTKGSKAQLGLHGVPVVFGTAQCEPVMPADPGNNP